MAVDDIDLFRARLPEVFEDAPLPPGFEDEWMVIPIESPEGDVGEEEALLVGEQVGVAKSDAESVVDLRPPQLPTLPTNAAGGPVHDWASPHPPPDAMAFYMPFHYYHPRWWGVYLSYEGTTDLATILLTLSRNRLAPEVALHVARVFLYAHEAYHHSVESFATRLEATHRRPLYRLGFEKHYRRHLGTDLSVEEALANAYALRKVATVLAKRYKKATRALMRKALLEYIKGCPPGYRLAGKFEKAKQFTLEQREFAEDNHHAAVGTPRGSGEMWSVFPQAFTGISRVTSRVNYIVHRSSPLAHRTGLNLRYIQRRRLERALLDQGFTRESTRGIHDKWKSRSGETIPLPRHSDIAIGTARNILQRAGLRGSLDAMLRG
jgi:predicted RNA binding protein YcfA (HicA-like mRNA interferase family)